MHQQFSQPRFFIFSNHFQNQHANNLIQKPNRLSTLYRKILILKQFSNKRTNEPTYFLNLDSHFLFQILSYCRCNMYYHPRFPNIFKHWAIPKSEINTQTYKKKWGREGWKIDWREGSEKNLVTAGYATQTEPVLDGRPVIGVPIEYTTRLYRNRETNGADGERQKRIEARVDRTIRYRPWWLSSFRVARVVSGEGGEDPLRGGGGKLKSSFTWKRFDWRRSANDFRSATARRLSTPGRSFFWKRRGGSRARLAEIRTARRIET